MWFEPAYLKGGQFVCSIPPTWLIFYNFVSKDNAVYYRGNDNMWLAELQADRKPTDKFGKCRQSYFAIIHKMYFTYFNPSFHSIDIYRISCHFP